MTQSSTDLNTAESQNFDAQQMTEAIAEGDVKAPKVDVAADYEAAQEFSVSDVDRTSEGAQAAEAAVAPQFEVHAPEETSAPAQTTGNPEEFIGIAKEISPFPSAAHNVTDEQVEKAIEMGTSQQ